MIGFFGVFLSEKDPIPQRTRNKLYCICCNIVLCLILSTTSSKVETTSNAAARLTGFFLFEKIVRAPIKALLAGKLSAEAD